MKQTKTQLEKDLSFCIDECGMDDKSVGEMLRVCEELGGISCEYFAEEFVFLCGENQEHIARYHDDSYLPINWSLN